jgi:hypothetical protein
VSSNWSGKAAHSMSLATTTSEELSPEFPLQRKRSRFGISTCVKSSKGIAVYDNQSRAGNCRAEPEERSIPHTT